MGYQKPAARNPALLYVAEVVSAGYGSQTVNFNVLVK